MSKLAFSSRTIRLDEGGVVEAIAWINLFKLSKRDREFICALVDLINAYEDGREDADRNAGGGGR